MRILFALLVTVIAGCKQAPELPSVISPYRIDIQQGNVVTQEMVAKLKAGMTRSQVRFVLGSPLVADAFHPDRWDYVYLLQRQGKADERRRVTVIFEADKLVRIEGDVTPTFSTQEAEKPAVKPPAAATPPAKPKPAVADKPGAPKPEAAMPVEKPAERPSAAATPAAKPDAAAAAKPAAPKSEPAKPDAAKSDAAATAKPAAPKPEAAKAEAAAETAGAGATPTADNARQVSVKTEAKSEPASTAASKTDTAKFDEKKEKPKEQGFFGRMLDKIGF